MKLYSQAKPGMDVFGQYFYTPEEYAEHVQSVISMLETYPNYHFYPLPEPLFSNMRVFSNKEEVTVQRAEAPYISFQLTHPLMCRAFEGYMEKCKRQYRKDKNAHKANIEKIFTIVLPSIRGV